MIDVCTYFHNLGTQHMFLTTYSLAYRIEKDSVLEKVWDLGRSLLEVRESRYVREFMTELKGMNRKK